MVLRDIMESAEGPAAPERAVRPPVEDLLPAAARALAIELRKSPGALRVVSSATRSYSNVWEVQSASGSYILKWLPLRADRELELTRLSRDLFADLPFVRTARIACCPTPYSFLVEKLPGEPLQNVCTSPPWWGVSRWIETQCRLLNHVGRWLRRYHRVTVQRSPAPLAGVKSYVLQREAAFPKSQTSLLAELLRAIDATTSSETVRVHGDFTPHNILVKGETVAVIDLAGVSEFDRETRWFDVAAMVVGLEETWRTRTTNYLRYCPSYAAAMVSAFMGGYGGPPNDPAFRICYAVRHMARIATRFRRTGRAPGPRDWHVQRLRRALESPDWLSMLGRPLGGGL